MEPKIYRLSRPCFQDGCGEQRKRDLNTELLDLFLGDLRHARDDPDKCFKFAGAPTAAYRNAFEDVTSLETTATWGKSGK